jgi:hypothetical protein
MCDALRQRLQPRLSAHLLMACFDSWLYHLQAADIKYDHILMCSKKQHTRRALAWPLELSPQHLTPPATVSAHVCSRPPAIAATLVNTAADGVFRLVVVPSPSCTHQIRSHFNVQQETTHMHSTCLANAIIAPASHTA